MKTLFKIILFLVIGCMTFSCSTFNSKNGDSENGVDPIALNMSSDEMMIYTLPSPFQVSAFVKLLDIRYSENLISSKIQTKPSYSSDDFKALIMGMNIVDLGYATLYDKYQHALNYMNVIENLMAELGIQNEKQEEISQRFEKNFNNKDSLNKILQEQQDKINYYFSIIKERKIGLLIISGFYIEGLYITTKIYEDQFAGKSTSLFMRNNFYNLILQQQVFLSNLTELLDIYDETNVDALLTQLSLLDRQFAELKIHYKQDNTTYKISNIRLKKNKIKEINSLICTIREKIMNETL